jgi:hypothetical protein
MRCAALALALCFFLAPVEGATLHSHQARTVRVKVKKNKVNGRKAPKRVLPSHSRNRTR